MPELDLFRIFISPLNRMGIRYMITGAVATIIYGKPRLTHDLDLVVELNPDDAEKFADSFPKDDFYCPPHEVIRLEISRSYRGHFNLIHQETGFKADIYTSGEDELHHWALNNRKLVDVEGEDFWLAPIEYVIIRKLEYYREGRSDKHIRDISDILEFSSEHINVEELKKRIHQNSLVKEWQKATKDKSAPF